MSLPRLSAYVAATPMARILSASDAASAWSSRFTPAYCSMASWSEMRGHGPVSRMTSPPYSMFVPPVTSSATCGTSVSTSRITSL